MASVYRLACRVVRRRLAVRLLAPDTGELDVVYATGRLEQTRRDTIQLSAEALERHELTAERR